MSAREPERPDPAVAAFAEAVSRRAAELAVDLVLERLDAQRRPFLSYAEAAEVAGVSVRTIRARVEGGELTRHALSPARPMVSRDELLALMAREGARDW